MKITLKKLSKLERDKRNSGKNGEPFFTSYRFPIGLIRAVDVRAQKAGISITEAVVQVLAGFVAGTTTPKGFKSKLKPSKHARTVYAAKKVAKKAIKKAKAASKKGKKAKKVTAKAKTTKTKRKTAAKPAAKPALAKIAHKVKATVKAAIGQLDRTPPPVEPALSREEQHERALEQESAD